MKAYVRLIVLSGVLGIAGVVPGGGGPALAATAQPAKMPMHPHGFVELMGEALSEVSLRHDQEAAVEARGARVEPLEVQIDAAEDAVLLQLADQVAAGRIDREALAPSICTYVVARKALSAELRCAIDALHDMLDAEQRADFADALESRVHEFRRAVMSAESLEDLGKYLGLSDEQKGKIREDLKSFKPALEAERNAIHRAIEAFRGDSFSVEQELPQAQVAEKARARAERIVDVTDTIQNALTAPQREKLAERIREAVHARSESASPTPVAQGEGAEVGIAAEAWVGAARGPRGRVFVGGGPGIAYRRVRAYPYAVGWGYGW